MKLRSRVAIYIGVPLIAAAIIFGASKLKLKPEIDCRNASGQQVVCSDTIGRERFNLHCIESDGTLRLTDLPPGEGFALTSQVKDGETHRDLKVGIRKRKDDFQVTFTDSNGVSGTKNAFLCVMDTKKAMNYALP